MKVTASALAAQRFLRGMRVDQLDVLAEAAAEVMFPARHRIFSDGDYADRFWLIESGHVVLDVRLPGEAPAVIGTVGRGGLLGWSWLVPPYQWAFGAVCVTEVRAFQFNAQTLRDRCATDQDLRDEFTRRLFRVLSERLHRTRDKLVASAPAALATAAGGRASRCGAPGRRRARSLPGHADRDLLDGLLLLALDGDLDRQDAVGVPGRHGVAVRARR